MNLELFIANRIVARGEPGFARPITRITIFSIVLGLAAMIVSMAIVTGFQQQIRDKVIGFGSHIQITRFDSNVSYEPEPVAIEQPDLDQIRAIDGVRHVQSFAIKAGIIKTEDQMEGVVLKGVGSDFDWSFFSDRMEEGTVFQVSDTGKTDAIILSKNLASRLNLSVDQEIRMYFIIENTIRGRKFRISGIYETGLEDFDNTYVLGDIGHIQKLNNWTSGQVSGYEVMIKDFRDLDKITQTVYNAIPYDLDAMNIRQLYPQMFDWLKLQDMNVAIILVLMVLVAGITMISTLLILILERTNMIGILKALGAADWSVRKIFLYNAVYLIGKGMLWGDILGLGLCLLQKQFGLIKLPQESYYVSVVPINLDLVHIILLNLGTLVICTLMLIVPSYIIARIMPARAIRFN
ncbi:MAG: ABC transporter permease [Bacteroidales bacterium]|nr:ABC transporter permease [Lentimicrobiaceae bacterium]MDD5694885.1 ABC transporter permease [Bacteroidales bacterium]